MAPGDDDDESEPDDGDATMTTTRVQQPPPAPLGCSGDECAANLPHDGDQAMEDGNTAAQHAAAHIAEGTKDGTAGVRNEGAGSATVGCGAHLDGTQGIAIETTARTNDETLGKEGSQGVAPAPMTDTGTAGTSEHEVHADACSAEGRGMDASGDFETFGASAASEIDADDMAGGDSGMTRAGDDDSNGARARRHRART